MVNDTISDMLTRIRNANLVKSQTVSVPLTRISQQICQILEKEGLIHSFRISVSSDPLEKTTKQIVETISPNRKELILFLKYKGLEKKPCITNLRRISKPGLRIYANHKEIPKILGGMGIIILSTSHGIMTDREARFQKIGGEVLCSIW